jgi:hypothetical protein
MRLIMNVLVVTVVVALAQTHTISGVQESFLDRSLSQDRHGDAVVKLPLTPASIGAPAERIGRLGRVPIGIEDCPEPYQSVDNTQTQFVLTGMQLREALDRFIELDPRYRWTADSGVIVFRPISAWNDAKNPLNRYIGSRSWEDVTLSDALDRAVAIVTGVPYHTIASPLDDRRFNVKVTNATVIELLNGIVRAHGELVWHVGYRRVGEVGEFGIGLATFEGHSRWLWVPQSRMRSGL